MLLCPSIPRLTCHTSLALRARFARHCLKPQRWLSTVTNQPELELFSRARQFGNNVAIVDAKGNHGYNDLLKSSAALGRQLAQYDPRPVSGRGEFPVAFLCPRDFSYVMSQWAVWRAGGIAVPLCEKHPPGEWEYYIKNSQARVVLVHPDYLHDIQSAASATGVPVHLVDPNLNPSDEGEAGLRPPNENAMLIYTSGTTGRPKGVTITHSMLRNQIATLVEAWEWSSKDRIVHTLPLHHVHGIVNALLCPLWSGAVCQMYKNFDPATVWTQLTGLDLAQHTPKGDSLAVLSGRTTRANVYMAVPTSYAMLAEWHKNNIGNDPNLCQQVKEECKKNVRLMASGSAPLPKTLMEAWYQLTGHWLLERYGMTETGMVLSNSLHGTRYPGSVGYPLPKVEVRIVKEENNGYVDTDKGDLWVRGPSVFSSYWNNPDATKKAFHDGWFITGDVASCTNGLYRLLGRASSDIIKTGGYKVSALEIESVLLDMPAVKEAAVLGVADAVWGEKVAAVVALNNDNQQLCLSDVKEHCRAHLARYKVPTILKVVDSIPRNVMGKVNKISLRKTFFPDE